MKPDTFEELFKKAVLHLAKEQGEVSLAQLFILQEAVASTMLALGDGTHDDV